MSTPSTPPIAKAIELVPLATPGTSQLHAPSDGSASLPASASALPASEGCAPDELVDDALDDDELDDELDASGVLASGALASGAAAQCLVASQSAERQSVDVVQGSASPRPHLPSLPQTPLRQVVLEAPPSGEHVPFPLA